MRIDMLLLAGLATYVNLYSARRGGPDNILDCGLIDGPLRGIAGRIHRVRCKLIGEQ